MNAQQRAEYDALVAEGLSHNLAEMFVTRRPPQSKTDAEFFQGRWNQFADTPHLGDSYRQVADPQAWVDGRGDVERVIDKHGWGAEGTVNRPLRTVAAPEMIPVAPDLVDREVGEILETVDPRDRARVDVDDLREQVVEKRKGPWCK
jgi:hypothetical protein